MPSKHAPIGIFDSGIGGLTVASAVHQHLPNEQLIYFGDTAHLPYGDKAPESIKYYSRHITRFLKEQGCKMIVIACNTASSIAFDDVVKEAGADITVVNVIDPIVDHLSRLPSIQKVGVIGTKGTIESGVYQHRIQNRIPNVEVSALATPLLVPMIEEEFLDDRISHTIIAKYLENEQLQNIDALILGCTHYPLIKDEIVAHYDGRTKVFDSANIVGEFVREQTQALGLDNDEPRGQHHFYVSDFTDSFEGSTRHFFKSSIHLEKLDFWT